MKSMANIYVFYKTSMFVFFIKPGSAFVPDHSENKDFWFALVCSTLSGPQDEKSHKWLGLDILRVDRFI